MVLEILKFVFSNFFIWFGFTIIVSKLNPFKGMIDKSTHIYLNGKELDQDEISKILKKQNR